MHIVIPAPSSTRPAATAPSPPARTTSPGVVVAVLAVAGIVVSLAQTLVVPILGSLPQIFATSASTTSWIVTATLLAGAVSTPVVGCLADMYGKKPLLLAALVPFVVGSVVCAVAGDVTTMIVGRVLQGLATGMVPLGIALLHDVLPADRAGSAIALMSSSMGIGGALGLPLAAAVTQFADWRALFWATAALAVAVVVAVWRLIPAGAVPAARARFDGVGAAGLAVGLVCLLLAVSKGSSWGWTSATTLGLLAAAVVVLAVWGWYELRHPAPVVALRTTLRPVVLLTNLASILIGFAMYAMNLIVPQVMQLPVGVGHGLGQSMLQMGMWMAPMGLGMMAVSSLGARISRQRGAKVTLTLAGVVIALGYGASSLVLATADGAVTRTLLLLLVGTTVAGCGVGLAFGSMPALIMSAVPASEKAAANGLNSLMRSFGTTVSAAVIGVVLASTVQQVGGHAVPTQTAFVVSLLIGSAGALVAAGLAALIPGRPVTPAAAH